MQTDEYLVELTLQGDSDCFGELINRWEKKIFSFILRNVGNPEEARDLVQDTFSKAYQNLDRLTDPARFSSWLYKIALNECRMRFRRHRGVQHVDLQLYTEGGLVESDRATPEKVLVDREEAGILRKAFDELPEEQRLVILMKEYQGLKFHEIAEILDIPLSTVKSRMYLGLKTLRRLLEKRL